MTRSTPKKAVPKKRESKDEIYSKVLMTALNLDFKKGHQRWTISELSRSSGVTRSLIYYYFGRSRIGILREALGMVGQELLGMSEERLELWKKGEVADSVIASRKAFKVNPQLAAFYLTHRVRDTELGEVCRKLEADHFQKMKTFIPTASSDALKGLFALFLGLVLAPNVSERAIRKSVEIALSETRNH